MNLNSGLTPRPNNRLTQARVAGSLLLPLAIVAGLMALVAVGIEGERDLLAADGRVADYWPTHGWRMAAPADLGLDETYLEEATQFLDDRYPQFVSFTVVRDGYIAWERFFGGRTNQITHRDLYSATKSVLGTLVGIAIDYGYIESVDQPLTDYFPEYLADEFDRRKQAITIRDLLTMRSGLEWSEGVAPDWGAGGSDWVERVLGLPMAHEAGEVFNYSSADSHLISALISEATGRSALNFAGEYLFDPMGINIRQWSSDDGGINWGGTGLFLTSRDMAAFGLLYANEGAWDGEQLVSREWIAEATSSQIVLRPEGDGPLIAYGYQWWLREHGGYESYLAIGFAGQYILVVPELDLVVVLTAEPGVFVSRDLIYETSTVDFPFFEEYVIPSATDAPNREPSSFTDPSHLDRPAG